MWKPEYSHPTPFMRLLTSAASAHCLQHFCHAITAGNLATREISAPGTQYPTSVCMAAAVASAAAAAKQLPAETLYHLVQSSMWEDAKSSGQPYFPPTYQQVS